MPWLIRIVFGCAFSSEWRIGYVDEFPLFNVNGIEDSVGSGGHSLIEGDEHKMGLCYDLLDLGVVVGEGGKAFMTVFFLIEL